MADTIGCQFARKPKIAVCVRLGRRLDSDIAWRNHTLGQKVSGRKSTPIDVVCVDAVFMVPGIVNVEVTDIAPFQQIAFSVVQLEGEYEQCRKLGIQDLLYHPRIVLLIVEYEQIYAKTPELAIDCLEDFEEVMVSDIGKQQSHGRFDHIVARQLAGCRTWSVLSGFHDIEHPLACLFRDVCTVVEYTRYGSESYASFPGYVLYGDLLPAHGKTVFVFLFSVNA